ncbi:MAG: TOTE conflict system archaeo-eukaryotic primase domain-containing protein, partial [Phocaeicola sp.]
MKNEVWTYQELLNAYKQIIVENEQLRNENKILRRLHTDKFPIDSNEDKVATSLSEPTDNSYVPILSLNEKVTLFRNLFRGREDVYARRWYSRTSGKSGYQPVCLNEWNPQLCNKKRFKCTECPNRQFKAITHDDLYRHLEGKSEDGCDVMGLYVMLTDNTCHFLCVDFDDKMCKHGYQNDVCSFVKVCKEWKIPYSLERSRSGNGAHVWIFFEEPLPATKVRKLGNTLLTEAMNRDGRISFKSYDRLFPSQDRLPDGGFGNLIALPLQGRARKDGNSVFVDDSFEPFEDQWAHLMGVKKISEKFVDELLSLHVMSSEFGELSTTKELEPWEVPSPDK